MKKLTVRNFIAEGVSIEGDFHATSSIRIDGKFKGKISIDAPHGLIVGPTGEVEGQIDTGGVIVLGKVTGRIVGDAVEIRKGGYVEAEIRYKSLEIFSGGVFKGVSESVQEQAGD